MSDEAAGNDSAGADTVAAGAGADTLAAGAGSDTVAAAAGNDTLAAGAAGDKVDKPTGTITDELPDGEADKPAKTDGDLDPQWREKLAGDDKALLATLRRYRTPQNYVKAGFEAQQRIRAGEAKKPLDANATPEERAEWRRENGVPEAPDAYVKAVELPSGVVVGEADKPILADFAAWAHDNNVPQADFNKQVGWYFDMQERELAKQAANDDAVWTATRDELRDEWGGPDFVRNQNAIKNYLSTLPDGLGEDLASARLPDGRKLGADARMIRFLAAQANETNPAGALLPPGTQNAPKAVAARLGEIQALMGDHSSAYWQGPQSSALQKEYRDLLEAQDRMTRRAA